MQIKKHLLLRLLSTKGFVGIGLISYSAYLWHQPLFAFARIYSLEHPSLLLMLLLTLLCLPLAYLSWRFIEMPFRDRRNISRSTVFVFSFFGLFFFSTIGFFGHVENGFKQRYSLEQQAFIETAKSNPLRPKCHFSKEISSLNRRACEYFFDNPSIAVIGNSHGTELAYALAEELRQSSKGIVHHTMSGCRHNYKKSGDEQTVCFQWHEKVLEALANDDSVRTVVVSYRNEGYIDDEEYRRSLVQTIERLSNANKQVILVLQAPLPGRDIYKYIAQSLLDNSRDMQGITKGEWERIYKGYTLLIEEIPKSTIVVNPVDLLCDDTGCDVVRNRTALYFDDDHLSIQGARIIAQYIANQYLLK